MAKKRIGTRAQAKARKKAGAQYRKVSKQAPTGYAMKTRGGKGYATKRGATAGVKYNPKKVKPKRKIRSTKKY